MSYLRQFPIDILKIDQSFVHQISSDSGKSPVVGAIIAMGKNLQLRVIAEGIETQAQLAFLQSRHCAEGQGYLFSRPVAAEQCAELLAMPRLEICREPIRHRTTPRTGVSRDHGPFRVKPIAFYCLTPPPGSKDLSPILTVYL